ncbi:GEVED domain-containing protein [Salegentibacter salegens]|uniref:Por secretion system C-terminal sorting domain-containing protein n=1 Tax=Salegentibacter salegens TaxID=143223 RepID=A0A1M7MQW6_9FLAO|nr:GEVED domain-containing protein [Salegentibacter salegens]PRX52566.1 putative secreted protein (Por secretion system target) [Salegentibacter salegens]SHM93456.1 Por secretion system C-terminal sorting domain-containing protein [Salegentibacter salegens]
MKKILFLLVLIFGFHSIFLGQDRETAGPVYIDSARAVSSSAMSKRKLIPPAREFKIYNPRNRGINKIVPGKGLPKTRDEALQQKMGEIPVKAPYFTFEAASTQATPTDPTGAAGPNHYVNGWNSAFSIFDKSGNRIMEPASLASIGGEFTNETLGDPIILYDDFADRFIISQFSDTPESFLIAVSQGPDPINDGWYTYRFTTNEVLPDYPKISVWGDGYYITTNKNTRTAATSQVVYALERDKMLNGETAQIMSFPLPGIRTNGFYSPAGFSGIGEELPPRGNSPIIFLQDDSWAGVNEDHLKLWLINVDWSNPSASTISESQELGAGEGVSPFIATFDGGSFSNLSQPGDDTPEVDVLQATMMYMTTYRRFPNYNAVVMNFVVDVDPSAAEHAGIRWYELRQQNDGGPWSVYQEGTYAPDNSDRFSGSIGLDAEGNIALGYTVLNDNPQNPVFPSLRYTGRYLNDEPGIMTIEEQDIIEGESPNPNSRYGDYAHLSVDAADGLTFWHNGEYFVGQERKNHVGVFKIAPDFNNDLGVVSLVGPQDASLGSNEEISVKIRNYGRNAQSNFEVSYSINGGTEVTETFEETLSATSSAEFIFSETADLSEVGETYEFLFGTNLEGDENIENDTLAASVRNLPPNDVGVTSIDAPQTGESLGNSEEVTVSIENFGGEPQQDIPVFYQVGNNTPVREVFNGTLEVGGLEVYSFNQTADISPSGSYRITAGTRLENDFDRSNDTSVRSVANLDCIPEGSDCSFGDGISFFELEDVLNERIPCGNGYADFIGLSATLDRSQSEFTVSVQSHFAEEENEQFSMWIDFNDDAVFEDDERVISAEVIPTANTWYSYNFSIPTDASLGQHLMRIRAGDTSFDGDLNNPCEVMDYGTTHDYSVNITDSTLNIEDFILNEAELVVVSEEDKQFRVIMETDYEETLRITIHNVLGQKMLENQVENNGTGYVYELDMSYAARGVYLVRMGTRDVGKVKRFIVK